MRRVIQRMDRLRSRCRPKSARVESIFFSYFAREKATTARIITDSTFWYFFVRRARPRGHVPATRLFSMHTRAKHLLGCCKAPAATQLHRASNNGVEVRRNARFSWGSFVDDTDRSMSMNILKHNLLPLRHGRAHVGALDQPAHVRDLLLEDIHANLQLAICATDTRTMRTWQGQSRCSTALDPGTCESGPSTHGG